MSGIQPTIPVPMHCLQIVVQTHISVAFVLRKVQRRTFRKLVSSPSTRPKVNRQPRAYWYNRNGCYRFLRLRRRFSLSFSIRKRQTFHGLDVIFKGERCLPASSLCSSLRPETPDPPFYLSSVASTLLPVLAEMWHMKVMFSDSSQVFVRQLFGYSKAPVDKQ